MASLPCECYGNTCKKYQEGVDYTKSGESGNKRIKRLRSVKTGREESSLPVWLGVSFVA